MKILSVLGAVLFFSALSLAQGTVVFSNRPATGDARFSYSDGRGAGSVPGATAQLYLVGAGGVLKPLYPTTTFRTTSEAAMYFVNVIDPFIVEGVLPGQPATFRIRVFQGSSFEAARTNNCWRLESNDVTVPRLGGTLANGEMLPAPYLNGLQGATLLVPLPGYSIKLADISLEGDQLRFTVENNLHGGEPCWSGKYVLEGSPDLKVWGAPILTNPPSSFTISYNQATDRNRFFRFRTLP